MASILERMSLIARSELSELRERFEDPEQAINQTIADAMVAYADLKQELGPVSESEAQAKGRLDSLTDEAVRWHRVAGKALTAGNEADARTALSREYDLKKRIEAQQGIYDQVHEVADKLRAQLAAIEDGITGMQAQVSRIKAKEAAVRATTVVGDVSSGSGTLDRLENEKDWQLAEAEGLAEAQRLSTTDPFEELARESERMSADAASAEVEAQLAALREQIQS